MICQKLSSLIKHGGILRALEILSERRNNGFSTRAFSYSWPKELKLLPSKRTKALVHFLIPHLDLNRAYGGIATLVWLAIEKAKAKQHVHFILCDAGGTLSDIPKIAQLKLEDWEGLKDSFSLSDFSAKNQIQIESAPQDHFIASAWWTKSTLDRASPSLVSTQLTYVIQDDESLFYIANDAVEGELQKAAKASYLGSYHAIINSQFLADYLVENKILNQTQAQSWRVIDPLIDHRFFYKTPISEKSKTIFVYARPEVRRNRFDLCLEALKLAAPKIPPDWNIVGGGSLRDDIYLGQHLYLRALGKLPYAAYAALCRSCRIALCLMESPRPSYPPLEFGACGAVVLCNRFKNKDYGILGKQYLCANLEAKELAAKLIKAIEDSNKMAEGMMP